MLFDPFMPLVVKHNHAWEWFHSGRKLKLNHQHTFQQLKLFRKSLANRPRGTAFQLIGTDPSGICVTALINNYPSFIYTIILSDTHPSWTCVIVFIHLSFTCHILKLQFFSGMYTLKYDHIYSPSPLFSFSMPHS